MITPQYFKRDQSELKMDAGGKDIADLLATYKDDMLEGADGCGPLGDMIFESGRSPLSNAIAQNIFRSAFKEIFDAFVSVGTFEAYLTVFTKIFGESVEVDFVVPAPGKLEITIVAEGLELSNFASRYIVDNEYLFDQVVDDEGDNIAFRTVIGFTSQYELEQMLFEMVPDGVYTEIDLTVGS